MAVKEIVTGALLLLSIALGMALSRRGRPLNAALSVVHKLVSLGTVAYTAYLFFGSPGLSLLEPPARLAGLFCLVFDASLIATGALLSGQKGRNKTLLGLHVASTALAVAATVFFLISLPLPAGIDRGITGYAYSVEQSGDDRYSYSVDRLVSLDLVHSNKSFGPIPDAETAAKAAATLHNAVYGELDGNLIVGFNANAKAWIVREERVGVGGGGCFAITRDDGLVVMAYHGK